MIDKAGMAQVLAKCAAYDGSRFPQPTAAMLEAWWEHFDQYPHVTLLEALEAVKVYYRDERADVPRAAHISKIARQLHQDEIDRGRTPEQQAAWEALCDAKAGEPQRALTAGRVNSNPATAEYRRKVIEDFVAAQAIKKGVQNVNTPTEVTSE